MNYSVDVVHKTTLFVGSTEMAETNWSFSHSYYEVPKRKLTMKKSGSIEQ